jgi:hypothetical protein
MPTTFLVPLQLTPEGRIATTSDPQVMLYQQIMDLLVTHQGERIMRPDHGADVQSFLFAPVIEPLLASKAAEIKSIINNSISFGEIVEVICELESGTYSTIRIVVYYRVFEQGQVMQLTKTFSGLPDEESRL